jgi:hypothetical protein
MATTITNAAATAMADALNTYINSGGAAKIIVYGNNVGAPANANTAIGSQTVLATFTCSNPAFASPAVNGVLTLDITPALTVAASASGTAAFFRVTLNNGTTVALQGSVGAGSGELNLNTTIITSGVNVTITSGTVTMPVA